jgi:MscS family membrane protein
MDISFFEQELFGNPLSEFAICIGILLFGLLLKRFGANFISKQSFRILKRFSRNEFSDIFVQLERKPLEQLITLLILYIAFDRLEFPENWHLATIEKFGLRWIIITVYEIAFLIVISNILLRGTEFFAFVMRNREDAPMSKELADFLKELSKVVIVILAFFAGLRFIFNVNITALVASLGIGGLAVALAAQDTLTNLLGSFIIYLDKPFKTGDQIETGDIKGVVEHVGFRTTRIRTIEKTLLTVPNKKMIDTALNNVSLSEQKRVRTVLKLTYDSRPDQIVSIIQAIRDSIVQHPETADANVVHFTEIDTSSLNILVVYFVLSNDDEKMMRVREELNFKMMEIVEANGCRFAFPSHMVYNMEK